MDARENNGCSESENVWSLVWPIRSKIVDVIKTTTSDGPRESILRDTVQSVILLVGVFGVEVSETSDRMQFSRILADRPLEEDSADRWMDLIFEAIGRVVVLSRVDRMFKARFLDVHNYSKEWLVNFHLGKRAWCSTREFDT